MRCQRLPPLPLLPLLLAVGPPAAESATGEEGAAARYLADDVFPGLHILERRGERGEERLRLYPEGQRREKGAAAQELQMWAWGDLEEARRELAMELKIPPRERYQLDWKIYNSQGRPLSSLEALRGVEVAFVVEIGAWMWPAVRVGFEHVVESVDGDEPKVLRTISVRPTVFQVMDFISPAECDEVISLAQQEGLEASEGMMQSADLDRGTDHNEFRTSKQTWLGNGKSPTVVALDGRTSNLTRVPSSHNEAVQVLRYDEGNYYHGHMDWTELEFYPGQADVWMQSHFGHQDRLATVFWYLNDVAEGGETIFLKHGDPICPGDQRTCEGTSNPDVASCERGFKVKPQRGSVIMWYNFLANGIGDQNALHMGCPVGAGLVKWSGNKWVSIKPLRGPVKWDENHPALKRYKFGSEHRDDPSRCDISFVNNGQVAVDVLWLPTGDQMGQLKPGSTQALQTFRSHEFVLQETGGLRRSEPMSCRKGKGEWHLAADFSVEWVKLQKQRRKRTSHPEL